MQASLLKKIGWLFACLLLGSSALRAQDLNLAKGKAATESSRESIDFAGSKATDGDYTTRWSSEFTDNQSLVVDLGTAQTVDRIRISWEAAYGKAFDLQVSTDASDASK